ncbi:hypothetical protein DHD08_12245 [Arenibacter sp. H213]|nr:hypothetical protein [Arenibacter sp. H213]
MPTDLPSRLCDYWVFLEYWKNQKGDVYLFVYEYGFLKKTNMGKEKYLLVTWQDYMELHK